MLGGAYGGGVGRQIGHLVAYLAPWMLAWVGFAVTFPLVFVAEKRWTLIPVAAAGFGVCIPIGLGLRAAWGLPGVAVSLGLATFVVTGGLLATLGMRTFVVATAGLARLALALGAATAFAFGGSSIVFAPLPAAVVGVLVYAVLIVAMRSLGLRDAWIYVRGLHT